MRTKTIFLLLAVMVMLSGCAKWHDRNGNILTKTQTYECENKCLYYENNKGAYTYDVCFKKCMEAKGYTQF